MDMETGEIILSRGLPKTGQETEYQAGDDGTYQAGWWKGLKVADNKTRLIAKTINGDDVVIDLATGLMWAADGSKAGCYNGGGGIWGLAVGYADALDFAGFTDWRLPNIKELLSIVDYSLTNPSIKEPPFSNTFNLRYWASTTFRVTPTFAWFVSFDVGFTSSVAKATGIYLRCVRGSV